MKKSYLDVKLGRNGIKIDCVVEKRKMPIKGMVESEASCIFPPISPSVAREKLDCLARKDKVMQDAFDHIRDGQSQLALRILAEELGIR
jgi:hypothetical protein